MTKPPACSTCAYAKFSTGFCGDSTPIAPLLAIIGKMPTKDELTFGTWGGKAGRHWWKEFIEPHGLTREDVLISSVLRCYPNGSQYPIGIQRKQATAGCRQWDTRIKEFAPNIIGVTFNPANLLKSPQQAKFIRRTIERAVGYAKEGYRPCILMGEEARDLHAPWLEGQMKWWQGNWWEDSLC